MAAGGKKAVSQEFTPSKGAPAYLQAMLDDIGLMEFTVDMAGRKHSNPVVEQMIKHTTGKKQSAIATAWCAYWGCFRIDNVGGKSPKSGMARSWLNWGQEVDKDDPSKWREGDAMVLWRGPEDDGVTGHLMFLTKWGKNWFEGVGGNQGDAVRIDRRSFNKLLGVRREKGALASRTVQGAGGSVAAEGASQTVEQVIPDPPSVLDQVINTVDQVRSPLETLAIYKPWITGVLSMLSIALALYALYCRLDDRNKGKNS